MRCAQVPSQEVALGVIEVLCTLSCKVSKIHWCWDRHTARALEVEIAEIVGECLNLLHRFFWYSIVGIGMALIHQDAI